MYDEKRRHKETGELDTDPRLGPNGQGEPRALRTESRPAPEPRRSGAVPSIRRIPGGPRPPDSPPNQGAFRCPVHLRLACAVLVATALVANAAPAADPKPAAPVEQAWVTKSNQNAKLLLEVLAKYGPEGATQLGIEGFDEKIPRPQP